MEALLPRTLEEALEMKAADPEAVPIAGGTDLMVDLNFDRARPELMIDVSRLPELNVWRREDGHLFLGAGVTYTRALRELPELREASLALCLEPTDGALQLGRQVNTVRAAR